MEFNNLALSEYNKLADDMVWMIKIDIVYFYDEIMTIMLKKIDSGVNTLYNEFLLIYFNIHWGHNNLHNYITNILCNSFILVTLLAGRKRLQRGLYGQSTPQSTFWMKITQTGPFWLLSDLALLAVWGEALVVGGDWRRW